MTPDERMLDLIRTKMNKLSSITYIATKGWLTQLLDSGETTFLTDFITLVFEKAASEPSFCPLYARLITELRSEFPHLGIELKRLFTEFLVVFETAAEEVSVGAEKYAEFVALRERRKYRRGYATFIGEVARGGALTLEDVARTCDIVLEGLIVSKGTEGQSLLTEEYADCLSGLVKAVHGLLTPELVARVRSAIDRTSPSMSNKARFALMDIIDLAA